MSYQPTLCVITPTIGRPTLRRTLESARLDDEDQWIILADGPDTGGRQIWESLKSRLPYLYFIETQSVKENYGNPLRDIAMPLSSNNYFIFLDDDDVFAPGAIKIIKREIAQHFPRPIMFRMINGNGELLWRDRGVEVGNVGGSMFCCPNKLGKLGKWANGHGHQSDFEFIRQTLEKYNNWRQMLIWAGDVIIHCRPESDKP